MEPHATSDAPAVPARESASAGDGLVDVEAILREVEALAGIAMQDAANESAAVGEPTSAIAAPPSAHGVHADQPVARVETPNVDAAPLNSAPLNSAPLDIAALEREIESLLRGGSRSDAPIASSVVANADPIARSESLAAMATEQASTGDAVPTSVKPSEPTASDVRSTALRETSVDPMLREIKEILDDSNDAVLRRSEGSIDRALDTVFDPRALSGQEEDVHRALIEAFGTSRRTNTSFGSEDAIVTNPVPRFEGTSRAMPPEIATHPRASTPEAPTAPIRSFDEIVATSIARSTKPEYAGETPFEPAFPAVPPIAASSPAGAPTAANTVANIAAKAAGNAPPPESTVAVASIPATSSPNPIEATAPASAAAAAQRAASDESQRTAADVPIVAANPAAGAKSAMIAGILARVGNLSASFAVLPVRLCALPMRFVPASARNYVTVAAVSMALWVPVAWWMAERSTHAPGIGRVEFPVASASDHGEPTAPSTADEHADAAKSSGSDASHADADHAAPSAADAHH
jgi:hypothetical protein